MNEKAVLILPETIKIEMKLHLADSSKLPKLHPLKKLLSKLTDEEIEAILDKDHEIVEIEKKVHPMITCTVKGLKMPIPLNWLTNSDGLE